MRVGGIGPNGEMSQMFGCLDDEYAECVCVCVCVCGGGVRLLAQVSFDCIRMASFLSDDVRRETLKIVISSRESYVVIFSSGQWIED